MRPHLDPAMHQPVALPGAERQGFKELTHVSETEAGVSAPVLAVVRCVLGLAMQQLPPRCLAAWGNDSFPFGSWHAFPNPSPHGARVRPDFTDMSRRPPRRQAHRGCCQAYMGCWEAHLAEHQDRLQLGERCPRLPRLQEQ